MRCGYIHDTTLAPLTVAMCGGLWDPIAQGFSGMTTLLDKRSQLHVDWVSFWCPNVPQPSPA